MVKMVEKQRLNTKQLVNALISFIVAIGGYFLWKIFNPPITALFALVLFFLVLIYLELMDKG